PLGADDLEGVEYVYRNFHQFGPALNYHSSDGRVTAAPTYADVMSATDAATGIEHGYLASEGNFAFVKALQSRNLIVPVVGDFAGPKALPAIGAYLKDHGATVRAFYVSNVETYLEWNGKWDTFCANVAAMPLDLSSLFIRPGFGASGFSAMRSETAPCRMR